MTSCHRCGTPWNEPGSPGFNNTCSGCGMPMHSCRNCTHFVPRGQLRCLVPGTPEIRDPAEGNRCGEFRGSGGSGTARPAEDGSLDAARRKWREMFGDASGD